MPMDLWQDWSERKKIDLEENKTRKQADSKQTDKQTEIRSTFIIKKTI